MCMHGGERAKATRLKATPGVFASLRQRCDNTHTHRPWTVQLQDGKWTFDTAAEAEYPIKLAVKMVQCAVARMPQGLLQQTYKKFRLDSLQSVGKQSKRHNQLIPEFKYFTSQKPTQSQDFKQLASSAPVTTGDDGEGQMSTTDDDFPDGAKFGIYFSHNEHIARALQLEHPSNLASTVPDALRRNLFDLLTMGYTAIAKRRILSLKRMLRLKDELAGEEKQLRANMRPLVSKVTQGKPLVLWERLLRESGFQDVEVVADHMAKGVELVGLEPNSMIYEKKYQPLLTTPQQLVAQSKWRRKATMLRPATDEEMEQAARLSEECAKEVELGFLSGPFDSEQAVSDFLQTDDWTLNKRFLLLQGEEQKPRVIDNCRDSGVNEAFGSSSYLALHDTDFLAGFLRFVSTTLACQDEVVVHLSTGEVLRGRWHPEMGTSPAFLGRCIDLSKAYKQVAVAPGSIHHGVLGHRTSDGGWQFHVSRSLPFGATAAVFSFNKISRGLWHLMTRELGLLSGVFYDDFPVIEVEPLQQLTTMLVGTFLDLMGWQHATVGKKATPFSTTFTALGVNFSLDQLWNGEVTLQNKPERIERLERTFQQWQADGCVRKSQCASVHGMLNFASGFVLGHSLKPLCKAVLSMMDVNASKGALSEACKLAEALLPSIQPKTLWLTGESCRFVVYTDGAFEDGRATWGALVWDKEKQFPSMFWGVVPDVLLQFWLANAGSQVICEIELFAHFLVRWIYRHDFDNEMGISFIDNEAARYSLVKYSSPSPCMRAMIYGLSLLDAVHPFGAWHERVPSPSNPADLPSRGEIQKAIAMFGAEPLGDIVLPDSILSFLMSVKFDQRLAKNACAHFIKHQELSKLGEETKSWRT